MAENGFGFLILLAFPRVWVPGRHYRAQLFCLVVVLLAFLRTSLTLQRRLS